MIQLYDNVESGNCYKVRLLLTQLGVPFERLDVSVLGDRDADRAETVRRRSVIGRIPTVVLDDGRSLAESTAILWYFADGTPYLPDDRLERARVLQWLAFEQNNHEPNIAVARHRLHAPGPAPTDEQVAAWRAGGDRALGVMDAHLAEHDFFVGGRYSIADIGLFAYTHVAEEGCFELRRYPAVTDWLGRVQEQPGFVPMR